MRAKTVSAKTMSADVFQTCTVLDNAASIISAWSATSGELSGTGVVDLTSDEMDDQIGPDLDGSG